MAWEPGGMVKIVTEATESALSEIIGTNGGIMTAFVGIVTLLDENGEQRYVMLENDNMTFTLALGMSELLNMNLRHTINSQLDDKRKEE